MLALLLVLIGVGVVGLKPWAPSSLVPSVAISPDLHVGLDESVALPPGEAASVADASPVHRSSAKLTAERVANTGDEEPATTDAVLAVSGAQPVVTSTGGDSEPAQPVPPSPAPESEPVAVPTPEPPSPPAAAPLAVEVVEGGPRTPIRAGVGGPGEEGECEGDEYVLVITPEDEGSEKVPLQLEIRIQYSGSDGSKSEVSLQGDETDVRELVAMFGAQGGCVRVEEESADGVVEPVGEEPEAGTEAAPPGETPEPDLP